MDSGFIFDHKSRSVCQKNYKKLKIFLFYCYLANYYVISEHRYILRK